ncbi:MAG TPA: gas vesicle protein GvpG [Dongiaceae bacterium]|nr:gas vesicle protein GvpG [Dongiaceae bacterium]
MFFIDTLLLSPIHGAVWAARQVHNAIQQERAAEPARITAELSELYMMLETGRLTEVEFDARERELLDRLDRLQEEERRGAQRAQSAPKKTVAARAGRSGSNLGARTEPHAEGRGQALTDLMATGAPPMSPSGP